MQLYALNQEGLVVSAAKADKRLNYFCPECGDYVRLRGGIHRRNHFFHFHSSQKCRHSCKSPTHMQNQLFLFNLFPPGECQLEKRFPSISRVADVVWESKKLIFEVQCSEIYAAEVLARNKDYASQGYQVIWLLHDNRYNKRKLSSAEIVLEKFPYYYTNINKDGNGFVYDQIAFCDNGVRKHRHKSHVVDLRRPRKFDKILKESSLPMQIATRLKNWPLCFEGDTLHRSELSLEELENELQEAARIEKSLSNTPKEIFSIRHCFRKYVCRPYILILQMLLEKACKG